MALDLTGRPPLDPEAEEPYLGKWVAVRDGAVVAAADEYEALLRDEGVRPEDDVYHLSPSVP